MPQPTITLVGRAHSLAFNDGTASWRIDVKRTMELTPMIYEFALQARLPGVLEQFERMDDGQLIGVIAELPPKRVPGALLTVTRLEILGKAVAPQSRRAGVAAVLEHLAAELVVLNQREPRVSVHEVARRFTLEAAGELSGWAEDDELDPDPDEEPLDWDDHPSLTAAQRNPSLS